MTAETELPAYLPYPRFLLKMDISHTAKLLYALLLDRSTLSQKNGWQDSEGRTYIVYPIAEIAEMLDKGCTTIKGALNELDAAGLLERRRNRLFCRQPPVCKSAGYSSGTVCRRAEWHGKLFHKDGKLLPMDSRKN